MYRLGLAENPNSMAKKLCKLTTVKKNKVGTTSVFIKIQVKLKCVYEQNTSLGFLGDFLILFLGAVHFLIKFSSNYFQVYSCIEKI